MNIFVGCSSRDTFHASYNKLAFDVGNFIIQGNHTLVFGGCEHGLMGKVYSVVSQRKDHIIITTAKAYEEDSKNLIHSKIYLYNTVGERKNGYTSICDLMLFLPGGIGTIDEILTAIETRRNHEHNLPIIILNIDHFFDNLLKMLDKIYEEDFANAKDRLNYHVFDSFESAKEFINSLPNDTQCK